MKTAFILFLVIFIQFVQGQAQPLFRIIQDGCIGYINEKGDIVIKPIYFSGNDFSEGLAAVRLHGLYGFIDGTGQFVIQPEYDIATNFTRGLALVYKDGKPYFINQRGEVALPPVYKSLVFLDERKRIVTTNAGRQGVIDIISKQLLIDTAFSAISDFTYGVAVVNEYRSPVKKYGERVGVIDTNGKFVVPFGKYTAINPFVDGHAAVTIKAPKNADGDTDGAIDTKGNLLFKRPYSNGSYLEGDFNGGYARFIAENHEAYINLKGQVVADNAGYKDVNNFMCGRAFVRNGNNDYDLIDRNFKRIGNQSFLDVINEGFVNGFAIVMTADGYGIMDSLGNFVVKPQFDEIDQVGIVDGYFFFAKDRGSDTKLYGIADLNGCVIAEPVMNEFDRNGFVNGLIKAIVNDRLTYINRHGQIVWQEQEDRPEGLKPLNIDFMNRGYFYAYSTPENPGESDSGGWATSENIPVRISGNRFPEARLAVTIDTAAVDTFANNYLGYKLFISNTTAETIQFNAQDSRLYLKLQAQNSNGEWRDIEYLPSSWCGNSYHTIELERNTFWSFTIPDYHGSFQTKIRAELKFIDGKDPEKDKYIYSNIINGSINPGQFWNKRTYHPGGLMDPYND